MLAVSGAVLAFVVGVPTLAAADPVNDTLNGLGLGSGSAGSGGGGSVSASQTEPTYTPPLHGTNPHGQGTDAVVDIVPTGDAPLVADPNSNGEDVVAGSSRGEQNSTTGAYHGSVTLAYLFGSPIIQVQTNPGESKDGPLQPLQDGLDQICSQSSGNLCLTVLGMHSQTTGNSSTNSFQALGAQLGGDQGLGVNVLSSEGNISQDSSCQTSHGGSNVAGAEAGGTGIVGLFSSSSDSQACNNGTSSESQNSSAVLLNEQEVLPGCADGAPNTVLDLGIDVLFCNANDENGSQTSSPYGVREALTDLLLPFNQPGLPLALLKGTTAASESHTVAPPASVTPTTPSGPGGGTKGAGGKGGNGNGNGNGNGAGAGGNGAAAANAAAGNGQLAFTGADLLALGMVGTALILGGLALTTTAGRRHRQTV